MYVSPLTSCLKPVAFCVCSVQQNDQIPCHQPLPLHGYDIYHLPAKGGLRLQGQHCAAGKRIRVGTTVDSACGSLNMNSSDMILPSMILMEIFLSLGFAASQEGEQCGDKLGPGGHLWLLQKPQHPLRTACCHCSWHWEGQSGASLPPSTLNRPIPSQTHPGPPCFLTHYVPPPNIFFNLSTLRTLRELLKEKNHYIFIRPAISTVCWAHDWWALFL